jgi:hypothetical protein
MHTSSRTSKQPAQQTAHTPCCDMLLASTVYQIRSYQTETSSSLLSSSKRFAPKQKLNSECQLHSTRKQTESQKEQTRRLNNTYVCT